MSGRVALLVHNRFEGDPRVSRHARAARSAGYRVAVLSVVAPTVAPRWRSLVDGIEVYESRILGRSPLGLLRTLAGRLLTGFAAGRTAGTGAGQDIVVMPGAGSSEDFRPQRGVRPWAALEGMAGDLLRLALLLRNNYGLFRQFRGVGAALVHANDLNVLPAGYLLAKYWHAPLVYDSHELWVELDAAWSPFLRRLFALLEGVLIRRAQAVVTVNGAIADELARRYSIERPAVVMNCAELSAEDTAALDGAHTPDQRQVGRLPVIYQGMFHRHSGLLKVIDAAAMAPEVALSIRGRGELREAIAGRIAANNLSGQVSLLDPVPMRELVPALRGYAVGLVPYLPVGMNYYLCSPNKLFEYMAAGLAVVCSDLPVLREVVTEADCGLLYEPGDDHSLAEALRRLARDPALVRRFQANALRAARTRYNAAHEEGRLLDLYRRLLHGSKATAGVSPRAMSGAAASPRVGGF